MATISKDSLAQFWLNAFPISSNYEYLSFTDSTIVKKFLEFVSEKNEEKKIFEIINCYIQQMKPKKIIKTIAIKTTSPPKRQRLTRNALINIDTNQIRFTVNVEVIENMDYEEEEIKTTMEEKIEGRD
jgi:hypothetical protein